MRAWIYLISYEDIEAACILLVQGQVTAFKRWKVRVLPGNDGRFDWRGPDGLGNSDEDGFATATEALFAAVEAQTKEEKSHAK